jgi:hypothetical protein
MKIETSFVNPPIPVRSLDWQAVTDGYEPGAPIGQGETEQEAIVDLKWKMDILCCPKCGAEDYDTHNVSPAVGDPSHKYCVCTHCHTEFPYSE